MRTIAGIAAVGFFFLGIIGLGFSIYYPFSLSLSTASAIQATQVYTQALYYAAVSLGSLIAALFCILGMIVDLQERAHGS